MKENHIFNFFKRIIKRTKKENQEISNNDITNNKLVLEKNNNFFKIIVKEECTRESYWKELKDIINEEELSKLKMGLNAMFENIKPQEIIILEQENRLFNIFIKGNSVEIKEQIRDEEKEEIRDNTIRYEKDTKKYSIVKMLHDFNFSTKWVKSYKPGQEVEEDGTPKFFQIDRKDATAVASEVIRDLSKINYLDEIININEIKTTVDLFNKKKDFENGLKTFQSEERQKSYIEETIEKNDKNNLNERN